MSNLAKSLRLGLIILTVLVVYAYGFAVTEVNLDEFRNEQRQQSRVRVLRALARPDIFEYEQEEVQVSAPVMVPCPAGGFTPPAPDTSGPYLEIEPACAPPGTEVTVRGFNFEPNSQGPLAFVPNEDPTYELALRSANVQTDSQGQFEVTYELPERPADFVQNMRMITRQNVGLPSFSENAVNTFDKIIETIFLALLATTFGTLLAIPLSCVAARNLMRDVRSRISSIAMGVLGWPLGIAIGFYVALWVGRGADMLTSSLMLSVSGLVVTPLLMIGAARWALPQAEESRPTRATRVTRTLVLLVATLLGILVIYLFADLLMRVGVALAAVLGPLDFIGVFFFQAGDLLGVLTPVFVALAGGAYGGNLLGKLGDLIGERLPAPSLKIANLVLGAVAGAALFAILGALINWIYEINNPLTTLYIPAAVGALLGGVLALTTPAKETLPIGIVIYYITRTILNAVRSIEALVMAIVAVIWVGIGPFAGTLALGLHTVVALAKLYSEQVESISPGPLEAVKATGANRLQTIVYAVVPQIIPPYISFTMYRWDINVRMSTIIGFVGGGGIGLLLQQNINLLNYRAASAQMVAIAIVVATMDYISSSLRERFV